MFRTTMFVATLAMVSAAGAPVGPPHLRVAPVARGVVPTTLSVQVEHHVQPESFQLTARAESRRGAERVVRMLPVRRQDAETFTVSIALERGQPWVIVMAAEQGSGGAHGVAEALVALTPDGAVHSTTYPKPSFTDGKPSRVSTQDVGAALSAIPVSATATPAASGPTAANGNATVDSAQSVVRWRGTKFGGRGAHAGTVRVRSGVLDYDVRRAELRGGTIELDMRSIAVTDMPLGEASARRKLTTHLLAADFFDVARYPTARYTVQRVTMRGGNLARLEGALTLRGVTRPFAFEATVWSFEPTRLHATARATLDRMQWGVAFRGSRLTNDLVDDMIHLEFDLVAQVRNGEATL
ncbi:MAG: YceI family protein [Gemmatimonadaceae bacterium]|jgi:polyisoprenoid-binding protein YceI|nr:YceI family protein [Gemmatimonadaceae bacterium]